jgi:hypothetical protein
VGCREVESVGLDLSRFTQGNFSLIIVPEVQKDGKLHTFYNSYPQALVQQLGVPDSDEKADPNLCLPGLECSCFSIRILLTFLGISTF